ncbi:hypothetical protein ES703_18826 [subsurface metagenome]
MKSLSDKSQPVNAEKKNKGLKGGYIQLYRIFKSSRLWKQKRKFSQFEAWLDMRSDARGVDTPGFEFKTGKKRNFKQTVDLKRGQLITSQRDLARKWGWKNRNNVVFFLAKLERGGEISVTKSDTGREYIIVTFINYDEENPPGKEKG